MTSKRIKLYASISMIILTLLFGALKWPSGTPLMANSSPVIKPLPPITSTSESTVNQTDQDKHEYLQLKAEAAQAQKLTLSTPKVSEFPTEGIPVLMYHSISTIPGNTLGVPVQQFTDEMEWLSRQSYTTLSLEEFYEALVNKTQVPEKPIVLTFDDGYSDNYDAAWPILHQYGFKATFFVTTNSVGPGMMNWDQLNDLDDQGNSVASHTVHHYDLATLSSQQQVDELSLSKKDVEDHLSNKVNALCFPSGQYNQTTLELMPKLGYTLGFTTQSGKVHSGDNPLTLKRMRISGGMSITAFQKEFP